MPNYYCRLNLSSAIFPFYTEAAGDTIITPNLDENFDRYNAANTTPDKGVPQVLYMHNVLPIAGGFQSVGYDVQIAGMPGHTDFDRAYDLRNSDLGKFIFVPAGGMNYIYDPNVGTWTSVSPFAPGLISTDTVVTTAFLNGQSYIYFSGIGCYKYDDVNKVLVAVNFTGVTLAKVKGICAANGYMILWSDNYVAWSSLTDPTNFIPSTITGAGGGQINDVKGKINFCLGITNGFILYCDNNCVGATYTSNTNYPYVFAEIADSGGVYNLSAVGWQSNLDTHLVYSTSGMQALNKSSAQAAMPEVSDFLAAQVFEDFNETTFSFSQQYTSAPLYMRVTAISDRYIVVSYGLNNPDYTHAIVFDSTLGRFGKLRINHRDCFNWNNPSPYGPILYSQLLMTPMSTISEAESYGDLLTGLFIDDQPKKTIGFLAADGTVSIVDMNLSEANADGVFILGKLKLLRSEMFTHQKTKVETVLPGAAFSLQLLPTFDGKDFSAAIPTFQLSSNATIRNYAARYTADNISLCFTGAYNLTSLVVNFMSGGSR